ncbi:unnamed protein product, partial [Rotaria sp. Silwood1]
MALRDELFLVYLTSSFGRL